MTRREFTIAAAFAATARSQTAPDASQVTLAEASREIRTRAATPIELTEACQHRIETYNPKINAWITVMREQAMAQAKALTEEQAAGKLRSPFTATTLFRH